MAEPTNFVQRLVEVLIRGEIARDNVCRLGRHTRRCFGVQAQLRVAFSDVSKECAADQPTAAGNNHCSQAFGLFIYTKRLSSQVVAGASSSL